MKQLLTLAIIAFSFTACNDKTESTETSTEQNVTDAKGTPYVIDSSSIITWAASKPTATHIGTFKISEGTVYVSDNSLTGGSFTIDLASISNQDLAGDPENKSKLEGHLKSPDFFDVAKYPTAKFEITGIAAAGSDSLGEASGNTHIISGNLSLKDSTKNVSFPAKVVVDAKGLSASGKFTIDRTDWGLNYKGPGNPQDWFISKNVDVTLDVKASKK